MEIVLAQNLKNNHVTGFEQKSHYIYVTWETNSITEIGIHGSTPHQYLRTLRATFTTAVAQR